MSYIRFVKTNSPQFKSPKEQFMFEVTIKTRENGPLLVTGSVKLTDHVGNQYDTTGKENIALCRCGASKVRPFCDGTHKTNGFQAAETVNKPTEQ